LHPRTIRTIQRFEDDLEIAQPADCRSVRQWPEGPAGGRGRVQLIQHFRTSDAQCSRETALCITFVQQSSDEFAQLRARGRRAAGGGVDLDGWYYLMARIDHRFGNIVRGQRRNSPRLFL
jgi:hypothetical protein